MVVLSNFVVPLEGIKHQEPNTAAYVGDRAMGKGTLYITDSILSWVNDSTQQGFSLTYPSISLHAVSRDQFILPQPCLYMLVDATIDSPVSDTPASQNEYINYEYDDEPDAPMTDVKFAPDDVNNLEAMFQAMNECQAQHPDPQDSFSDDDEIYEDAEDDDFEYYEVGAGDAPYIMPTEQIASQNGTEEEENMDVEAGQFEDAEEDP